MNIMNELLNIMIEAAEKDKNFKLVRKLKPYKNHPLVSVVHGAGIRMGGGGKNEKNNCN